MAYRKGGLGSGSLPDPGLLAAALVGYEQQRSEIVQKISEIKQQLGGRAERNGHGPVSVTEAAPAGRRTMSAVARKRIAAAQKKRWAVFHKEHAPASAKKSAGVQKGSAHPVRKMSAAARKRISEASKKRWAAFRAKKSPQKPGQAA